MFSFKFMIITQCMFDKNVYKMTVVCCNYAVASYLWSVTTVMTIDTMLPSGKRSIGENTSGWRVSHA